MGDKPGADAARRRVVGQSRARHTGQGRRESGARQEEVDRTGQEEGTRGRKEGKEDRGAQASMSAVTIYHNTRCGTSRKTLELIRAKGIEPTVIEYLQHPPSASELDRILLLLKMEPRDLMRKKEDEYKGLKLDRPELTRQQLIKAMVAHPILIERPIVLSEGKAALGRPPENVSSIL